MFDASNFGIDFKKVSSEDGFCLRFQGVTGSYLLEMIDDHEISYAQGIWSSHQMAEKRRCVLRAK